MKTLCVISARGGSQGVPGKNIRDLLGKPVIVWAIEKALNIEQIDRVAISTDSREIADIAKQAGADIPFIRPDDLATSKAGKFQVWQHALENCEKYYNEKYDVYIDLDCTNPLIDESDIIAAISQFNKSKKNGVNAIFTVCQARRNPYFNLVEPDNNNALKMSKDLKTTVLCRQDAPAVYEHVAGVYVLDPGYLHNASHLLEGHAEGYEVEEGKNLDIDSEFDFLLVEYLMKQKLNKL